MIISLEWLSDFLPGPLDGQTAADALTGGGLPVEVIERHGDDTVIDAEVTSNRGDCLSHLGIARELSALLSRPLVNRDPIVAEVTVVAKSAVSVAIEATHLCPHYTARVIRKVKIGPSPDWMKRRLEAVGLRPINNIVDVTNYVLFELGQPLHAFDLNKVSQGRIIVRLARAGEMLVSIDGHERKLTPDMLIIADGVRPVALAGVMGGRDSEVTDSTVNILLESARFDPLSVRTTSRRLALQSDSSYRFERGIDPTLPMRASARAAQLILETAGGELLAGVVEAGIEQPPGKMLSMRLERLQKLLGFEIPAPAAVEALTRLQLKPILNDGKIDVTVPSWRSDLNIEVDLIEEVARMVGYDKIPVRDQIQIRLTPPDPREKTIDKIRSTLVSAGFFEAVTVTFISDALVEDFKTADVKLPRAAATVRKADAHLRPSMLPGLLEVLRRNESAGSAGAKLFEIGSTFALDPQSKIDERRRLGLVGGQDLRELRGTIESLLHRLDSTREVAVNLTDHPGFDRSVSGWVSWGGEPVGFIGKMDRNLCTKMDLRQVPVMAELEMLPLLSGAQHVPHMRSLPRFPAMRRDLSLVVPESVRFAAIRELIDEIDPPELEEVEYVGVYRGKPLDKGVKSQTISLVFRSANQTLTSEAVDASVKKVIDAAESKGFKLRV